MSRGLWGCFAWSSHSAFTGGLHCASGLLVWSRGWFSVTHFFNAFVFQKCQCEVYWSPKQTGVGETGHALSFPGWANMGLASLMRHLQWPRRAPPVIAGPLGQSSRSFCLAQLRTGHKYDFLTLKQMLQLLYAGCELDCHVLTRNDVMDLRNLISQKFHCLLHVLIKSFPLNELQFPI